MRKSNQFGIFHSRIDESEKSKFNVFLKSPFLEEVRKMRDSRDTPFNTEEFTTLEDYRT